MKILSFIKCSAIYSINLTSCSMNKCSMKMEKRKKCMQSTSSQGRFYEFRAPWKNTGVRIIIFWCIIHIVTFFPQIKTILHVLLFKRTEKF